MGACTNRRGGLAGRAAGQKVHEGRWTQIESFQNLDEKK